MTSSTPRTLMFIGAGFISRFSHASNLNRLPDGETCDVCVADPNPDALAEFRKVIPRAETFSEYKVMLASRTPTERDIVIIATAPFLHYSMTLDAFASGRHVLCEKPLALTAAEGRAMLEEGRRAGRLLGCCSSRAAHNATTARVRDLITTGRLGEVYHASMVIRQTRSRTGIEYQPGSRFFLDRSKNGGGPVFDWGPYEFSTMLDALNPERVEVVHAWLARPETDIDPVDCVYDVEEHAGATIRFEVTGKRPVVVDYERSFCTHGDETPLAPITFQIEGTRGAVKWDWLSEGQGLLWFSRDQEGKRVTEEILVDKSGEDGMHSKPIIYFDRAVRGEDSPAYVNEEAVARFEVLCAIYKCAESGRPCEVAFGACASAPVG